ncbi:RNA-binding S4 domain-containing protein [Wenzhouxiangella limi]|uniref:Heat shock protein 15 n=1 Tax=Wenzhouxiangella limi TaxID=2707351 RepID=A0A845UV81_9GAMM|nr:RNA-binding S4 domain-containing protein [Wenzhouxiangella limi]NDY94488.1 RNA-binding S4 domain-containing protein [Wenzhouxiangella limi]
MTDPVRLDKWLWAARFFKTRSLAQQAIRGGKIELNGDKPKASRLVRAQDRLRISKGEWLIEVDVIEVGEKRVSAPLARQMYQETEDSRQRREAVQAQRAAEHTRSGDPGKRPDKHSRRALRRIHRGD